MTTVDTRQADVPSMARLVARVQKCDEVTEKLAALRPDGERASDDDAHVYFIQQGGDGPVKIGCATNIWRRLAQLQTASSAPLRIIGVVILGGRSHERLLHRHCAPDHLHGEWFAPTERVLDAAYDMGGAR